ncbi:hypothetical protein [Sphingomonas sp. 28-63-12]|uniref:hypothetical protein n=1 Tax=Sphingomonas sp. 28-63-12 TaxID=1970434 RepID=UPI000BC4DEC1|nr:MAG: hypothetical protein B7Y47_06350 [Sphingomonas sp. 28-63-12]
MTKLALISGTILALTGCSGASSEDLPPLPTIEAATLKYANCVDQAAQRLGRTSGSLEQLAQQGVSGCSVLRTEALKLKAVPVMFPTTAEFDATHLGVARQAIENVRRKNL